jgi:type VI secretion system secreted protein Hcp
MAQDNFLKINGIDGESQDKAHSKEIDVLSFSFGATNSGTAHLGSGAGAGKVNVQDLSVTKYVDKASPNIMLACMQGKHIDECVLTVRKAGENPLEHTVITMNECLVTSHAITGHDASDRLQESVSINFGKIKFAYKPQKSDGTGDAEVTATYNIAQNTKE